MLSVEHIAESTRAFEEMRRSLKSVEDATVEAEEPAETKEEEERRFKSYEQDVAALKARPLAPGEHPLQHVWSFWYFRKPPGERSADSYERNIQSVGCFNTIEGFWRYYSHLVRPSELQPANDFHVFKDGVRPMWEDAANKAGGKWVARLRKGIANRCWEDLLLAVLGEQFNVGDEICGVIMSIRYQEDILSIWNRSAQDQEVKRRIFEKMRELLSPFPDIKIEYKPHDASLKDLSTFRSSSEGYERPPRPGRWADSAEQRERTYDAERPFFRGSGNTDARYFSADGRSERFQHEARFSGPRYDSERGFERGFEGRGRGRGRGEDTADGAPSEQSERPERSYFNRSGGRWDRDRRWGPEEGRDDGTPPADRPARWNEEGAAGAGRGRGFGGDDGRPQRWGGEHGRPFERGFDRSQSFERDRLDRSGERGLVSSGSSEALRQSGELEDEEKEMGLRRPREFRRPGPPASLQDEEREMGLRRPHAMPPPAGPPPARGPPPRGYPGGRGGFGGPSPRGDAPPPKWE
eukprot:TRINITY_DN7656_c0_g1_i2.p1 TRINITY_DN7656_c0_g1~~TRINITY_DN7656_c0_g1_i2.p1  ORF type:complete len:523 (-),score=99.77 TRINITY_DN7656_c0_g1_i2:248-1816(-)